MKRSALLLAFTVACSGGPEDSTRPPLESVVPTTRAPETETEETETRAASNEALQEEAQQEEAAPDEPTSAGERPEGQVPTGDEVAETQGQEAEAAEAAEAGDAAEDEESTTQEALMPRPPSGPHLTELVLAPEMNRRTPVDPRARYNKANDERVYCLFRMENPDGEATNVTLAWENADGDSRRPPTEINVPAQRRFVHYRYTTLSWRRPGSYACVVRNADAAVIGRIGFEVE